MDIGGILFLALLSTVAILMLLHELDMRLIAGYMAVADIAISFLVLIFTAGTISGLMIGAITGLFLSLYLRWYRRTNGFSRFRIIVEGEEKIGFFTHKKRRLERVEFDPVPKS
jgi:hypothetical protein